jgi:hypothetical protein
MDSPIDDTEGKLGQGFTSTHLLEEVNIGPGDRPRPTYVSAKLDPEYKQELIDLLNEYQDYFAWEYYEMPGLSRSIMEHRLPIKDGYRPFKAPRRFKPKLLEDIKKEITRLYEAKFIQQCRYVDWILNIVPMLKKNGKLRVCRLKQSHTNGWLSNADS